VVFPAAAYEPAKPPVALMGLVVSQTYSYKIKPIVLKTSMLILGL
jgi:hypothetical protein